MRLRKLDSTGDMVFGHSASDFWRDQPELVAQSIVTRLGLYQSDWWLDLTLGTPYRTQVLGVRTDGTRDMVMRSRVAQTPGVQDVVSYASQVNRQTRTYSVQVSVNTIYGNATFTTSGVPIQITADFASSDFVASDFAEGVPAESATPTTPGFQVGFAQP